MNQRVEKAFSPDIRLAVFGSQIMGDTIHDRKMLRLYGLPTSFKNTEESLNAFSDLVIGCAKVWAAMKLDSPTIEYPPINA